MSIKSHLYGYIVSWRSGMRKVLYPTLTRPSGTSDLTTTTTNITLKADISSLKRKEILSITTFIWLYLTNPMWHCIYPTWFKIIISGIIIHENTFPTCQLSGKMPFLSSLSPLVKSRFHTVKTCQLWAIHIQQPISTYSHWEFCQLLSNMIKD